MKNITTNNRFIILLISSLLFFDLSCSKNDDSKKEIVETDKTAQSPGATASPEAPQLTDKKSVKTVNTDDKLQVNQTRPAGDKIVYILIDALRADRLGCYGFKENTSPAIDKLASQGVLFENVHSAAPWTEPSFGTLFTGVSPTVHGAGEMLSRGSKNGESIHGVTVGGINSELKTMPELLPANLKKGAIINNAFVSRALGFAKGFDTFDYKMAHLQKYRTADEVTDSAITWLKENSENPYFLFVHYFDPHIQYAPPKKYLPEFAPDKPKRIAYPFIDHNSARDGTLNPTVEEQKYIKGLYNGEVRFVDDEIGRLLEAMDKMHLMDNSWIVVVADHGEEHFEHGSFEHGHRYEEEVTHVPLIIRAPKGKWYKGKRVTSSVSHIDVLPTVLDIAKVSIPKYFEGSSLVPLITGKERANRDAYMEFNLFMGQQCAYYDGRYKIVKNLRNNKSFMYDLKKDPLEQTKLDDSHPMFGRLLKKLEHKRKLLKEAAKGKITNSVSLSDETSDALKSLGYIK